MADQQVSGEAARNDFWRKMSLPLVALLFAGNDMKIIVHFHMVSFFLFVIVLIFCRKGNWEDSLNNATESSPGFAFHVISAVFLPCVFMRWSISKSRNLLLDACYEKWLNGTRNYSEFSQCLSHNNSFYSELITAWERVIISAALTYIILIYCLSTSRQKNCPFPCVYQVLVILTVVSLYFATGAGVVKMENLVVYFKTASLIALLCCAPHLYPGINPRRSTAVVLVFYLFFLPLASIGIWLLISHDIASNDTIIAKVDEYKYSLGAIYLILRCWESLFWLIDNYDKLDDVSEV